MGQSTERSVKAFLDGLDPHVLPLVQALRRMVRDVTPEAVETVIWDALSYHRPWLGGRVKGAVCQIVVRRGHVRLDFVHGVALKDPGQLLQGAGLSKRYVPIDCAPDATRPEIALLIDEAAQFIPGKVADRRAPDPQGFRP
jgi:hypothetical protein